MWKDEKCRQIYFIDISPLSFYFSFANALKNIYCAHFIQLPSYYHPRYLNLYVSRIWIHSDSLITAIVTRKKLRLFFLHYMQMDGKSQMRSWKEKGGKEKKCAVLLWNYPGKLTYNFKEQKWQTLTSIILFATKNTFFRMHNSPDSYNEFVQGWRNLLTNYNVTVWRNVCWTTILIAINWKYFNGCVVKLVRRMLRVSASEEKSEKIRKLNTKFIYKLESETYLFITIGAANLKTSWSPGCGNNPQKKLSPKYALSSVYCL